LIFDDSNPYGEILNDEININFEYEETGDIGHLHGDPIGEQSGLNIEPSKDSVSWHIENRKEILKTQLEEKIRNQSMMNLLSFGIIAGVGVLILKRYWK
jgi:hypothetical protein